MVIWLHLGRSYKHLRVSCRRFKAERGRETEKERDSRKRKKGREGERAERAEIAERESERAR